MVVVPSSVAVGVAMAGLSLSCWDIARRKRTPRLGWLYFVGLSLLIAGLVLLCASFLYREAPSGSLVFSKSPLITTKPAVLNAERFVTKGERYPVQVLLEVQVTDPEALLKARKPGELETGLESFLKRRIGEGLSLEGSGLQVVPVGR